MTARPAETISPQAWRLLFERLASPDIDWEQVAEHLERGRTGKLEIDIKCGEARGGRILLTLGK